MPQERILPPRLALLCCASSFYALFGWPRTMFSRRAGVPGPAVLAVGILVALCLGVYSFHSSDQARFPHAGQAKSPSGPYGSERRLALSPEGEAGVLQVGEGNMSAGGEHNHTERVIHPISPHAHMFAITEIERKAGLQANKDKINHCAPGSGDPMCIDPDAKRLDLTKSATGYACLAIFVMCYMCVIFEEFFGHGFRKSIPMTVAAGILWALVAWTYSVVAPDQVDHVSASLRHNVLEFSEVFMFLLVAMTFINTMECMNVFAVVRVFLVDRGYSLKAMFWITGLLAFVLSPIADNLTTALLMGAVVVTVGGDNEAFVSVSCVNIVVAANAGGAFSPFGDITTLMVWQKGKLEIHEFFAILLPSIVNWIVPALIMSTTVRPDAAHRSKAEETVRMLPEAIPVVSIFLGTVFMSAVFHGTLHLPPVLGMMTGLGILQLYGFLAGQRAARQHARGGASSSSSSSWLGDQETGLLDREPGGGLHAPGHHGGPALPPSVAAHIEALDIFKRLEHTEWDTLLFFYGVIMSVGLLGLLGYLDLVAQYAYGELGANVANMLVGLLSSLVDNIPVMFAVLSTDPPMSQNDWLLCTLTAGTGGSLLSVGSAAGVGLMGVARGSYNFWTHFRWSWAVLLGYCASIGVHFLVNGTS